MNNKNSKVFIPGLYDKMIDENTFDTNNKLSKIIINKHNKTIKKVIHSECILRDSYLGNCTSLIRAHSIHNNGIINKLSENNYTIVLDNLKDFDSNSHNLLMGRNEATTFRGFCKKHDEVFRWIEDYQYGFDKPLQNYLFAYRAFCKMYVDSKTSFNYYMKSFSDFFDSESLENTLEKHADIPINNKEIREKRKYLVKQRQEYRVNEFNKLIDDNDKLKLAFNANLRNEKYYKVQTLELDFKVKNILACSSTIDIITDFNGKLFNKDFKYPIFLTIFPDGDSTKVLISYLKGHSTHLERIINPIKKSSLEQQEVILSNILVKKADNIIYNPIEFNKFSKESIDILKNMQRKRTQHPRERLVTMNFNIFRPQ